MTGGTSTNQQLDDIQVLVDMGEEGETSRLNEVNITSRFKKKLIGQMEFARMLLSSGMAPITYCLVLMGNWWH